MNTVKPLNIANAKYFCLDYYLTQFKLVLHSLVF